MKESPKKPTRCRASVFSLGNLTPTHAVAVRLNANLVRPHGSRHVQVWLQAIRADPPRVGMEKVQFLWRVPALARPPLVDAKAHLGRRQSEGQPQKEGESGKQKVLSRRRAGDGTIVFTHAFRVKKRKEFTTPALSVQSSHHRHWRCCTALAESKIRLLCWLRYVRP